MITNLDLSKADNAILKIIIDELCANETDITTENIRQHPLFAKIDQQSIFENDHYSILPIGIGLGQKEPGKFTIEISGTGINLNNPIHRKILTDILEEATGKLSILSKITEKLGLSGMKEKDFSMEDMLKDMLMDMSKKWRKN